MARSTGPKNDGDGADVAEEEEEIWGTWEELLLACAVNRHGPHSWDSVAGELRSRISSAYAHRLTPDLCRSRYRHLHRRFAADGPDHDRSDPTAQIPWLDQLRNLRVADLRRQLHRSDVSIGSLRLKVKRLKEERTRSQKEPDSGGGSGSDPVEEKKDADPDPDRSCKESNSTDQKEEQAERIRQAEPDPVPGSGSGRAGETSYNGSSDTFAKGAEPSPLADPNPVNESGESVAESKGAEPDGTKESSDVQSSASLSRRRRRGRLRKAAASDSGGADAPVDAESQPLISVLETIRSSECGPTFERRLESQEGVRYEGMIRRHVDLEIIQRSVGRKGFTPEEFFRDLLLMCANAIVFFPKSSPESIAAVHLRDIINKEISAVLRKSQSSAPPSAKEPTPPPISHPKAIADPEPDKKSVPILPTSSLPPLVVCRKRSFISAKPANKPDKDEKPKAETIEKEEVVDKKSTKQRSAVARGLRTNKSRGGSKAATAAKSPGTAQPGPKEDRDPEPDPKPAASAAKKRSAANFLNRMNRSPPLSGSSGLLLEMLKGSSSGSTAPAAGKRGEKKKPHEDGRKEKEKESNAVKRSVGRPPKRTAAAPAKRKREETAAAATPPPQSKKRARK